jgi:hypothetical protein
MGDTMAVWTERDEVINCALPDSERDRNYVMEFHAVSF